MKSIQRASESPTHTSSSSSGNKSLLPSLSSTQLTRKGSPPDMANDISLAGIFFSILLERCTVKLQFFLSFFQWYSQMDRTSAKSALTLSAQAEYQCRTI